jgi:outer membrane lipoprotein-sorting protein
VIKRTILLALLLILSVILFESCAPSKKVSKEKILPADRLVKKLEANRRKIKTFEGSGIINVDSPKMSAKASFEILLKKPDSIRISVFGPFGIDVAKAVVSPDKFTFYDVMNNKVYKGDNNKDILKKIFKVDIAFEDLMDAFTGSVDLTDKLRKSPDKYDVVDDKYNLTYIDSSENTRSEYEVSADDFSIQQFRLFTLPDKLIFEGEYSRFKDFEGIKVPMVAEVDNAAMEQRLDIEYRNVTVNGEIKNLTFNYPSDAKVIQMK